MYSQVKVGHAVTVQYQTLYQRRNFAVMGDIIAVHKLPWRSLGSLVFVSALGRSPIHFGGLSAQAWAVEGVSEAQGLV